MNKVEEIAKGLLKDEAFQSSRRGKLARWLMFKMGFSRCQHCIYCNFDGKSYRGVRESVMLTNGTCHWSKDSSSSSLTRSDLLTYHRCPAFTPMLYNFKDYGIDPREVERIRDRRLGYFFTWAGWAVAVFVALISAWLM